jgi:tripartite-type tricarboxylate transporter receptor subunit TctC
MFTRRQTLATLAGCVAAPTLVRAQAFPAKPITLVVAYPAGGPTDAIARIIAQDLAAALGQNVVVDNRPGASGAVGTRSVARADADGHTITFGNNQTHGNNMFLLKEPGYDAVKDFAPLLGLGAFEHVFVVRNDLPVKTIGELVALAKTDPGKLNYGSTGVGSGSHLSTELFMARTGIKMTHVPFRGAAPLVQEISGNRIDVANSTLPSVLEQIRGGLMRAIAIGSAQRNAALPNVPTLREAASVAKPPVRDAILKTGFTLNPRDPAAFKPYHQQEIATWKDVIAQVGLKAE